MSPKGAGASEEQSCSHPLQAERGPSQGEQLSVERPGASPREGGATWGTQASSAGLHVILPDPAPMRQHLSKRKWGRHSAPLCAS